MDGSVTLFPIICTVQYIFFCAKRTVKLLFSKGTFCMVNVNSLVTRKYTCFVYYSLGSSFFQQLLYDSHISLVVNSLLYK